MANRKGLGVSKKYAVGSVHENATGKFTVLERYADGNVPMLTYQWLNGEKEGKIEDNKEINMAASIHKFQVLRGKPTVWAPTDNDTIEDLREQIKALTETVNEMKQRCTCNNKTEESV